MEAGLTQMKGGQTPHQGTPISNSNGATRDH